MKKSNSVIGLGACLLLAAAPLSAQFFDQTIRLSDTDGNILAGTSGASSFSMYTFLGPSSIELQSFAVSQGLLDADGKIEGMALFDLLSSYIGGTGSLAIPGTWPAPRILQSADGWAFGVDASKNVGGIVSHPNTDGGREIWALASTVPLFDGLGAFTWSTSAHAAFWLTPVTLSQPADFIKPARIITAAMAGQTLVFGGTGSVVLAPIPEPSTYAALFG